MRFLLLTMTVLLAILPFAGVQGAINPEPCYEPWVCVYPPVITASPSGPSLVCPTKSATFAVNGAISIGTKRRCREEQPVVPNGIAWGWVVSGPESASGGTNSFVYTPTHSGTYTITWTGYASGAEPCTVAPYTTTQIFTVPSDSAQASLTSADICLGKSGELTWRITNTGSCTATFGWLAYALDGDPIVSVSPQTGSATLAPGQTGTGVITATVRADSPRGAKTVHFEVDTPTTLGVARATSIVTVPAPKATVSLGTAKGCPGLFADVPWTITNTGLCRETFTWTASATAGAPVITLNVTTGTVDLAPGASQSGWIPISVAETSPRGVKTIHLVLTVADGTVVWEGDGSLEVPPPTATGTIGTVLGCRGSQVDLPWTLTNNGHCRERYTWTAAATTGDPLVTIAAAAGTVDLLPNASQALRLPLRVAANSPRGIKTIHVTVKVGGILVWEGDGSLDVPPPKGTVRLDDATGCPGTVVGMPYAITNTGSCPETFTLRLTQTAGSPPATILPLPPMVIQPGGTIQRVARVRLGRPSVVPLTFKLEALVDTAVVGSDTATVTPNPLGVNLSVEGGLSECMEGRVLTFTATATGVCWTGRKNFTFYFQRANGSQWTASEWTMLNTVDVDAVADQVPNGNANHFFVTPIGARCADSVGNVANAPSLSIKVYELWIKTFADSATGKAWKVCVGDTITHDAIASSDCKDFVWDMEDGVPDAWNPTGGNAKTGSGMVIPNSDKARAASSWFGETYGTVTVSCKDGEDNEHVFLSSEMRPSRKAAVFFDPDTNREGGAPSDAMPPAWYYFWKQAGAVDGLAETGYIHFYNGHPYWGQSDGTKVYLGSMGSDDLGPTQTRTDLTGAMFTLGGVGKHLKCVAGVIAHEAYHNYIAQNFAGAPQTDTDRITDAEEVSPHRAYFPRSDPANPDTFGYPYTAGPYSISDNEVRCRVVERYVFPATHPERDWSKDVENPKW